MAWLRARDIINQIINSGAKDLLRSAGFRKSGFNFHRRCGEVIQVINFQLSQANFADQGEFFVNFGLAFDRLRELEGQAINERLSQCECYPPYGFSDRLEGLLPGRRAGWEVSANTNVGEVGHILTTRLETITNGFNQIDSIHNFLNLDWPGKDSLSIGTNLGLCARMYYVLGDFETAARFVQREAAFFAERPGVSVEWIVEQYKLTELKTKGLL